MMNEIIKFLDLKEINSQYRSALISAFESTLDSGWYVNGKQLELFESSFAQCCNTAHAIGTSNGLDALRIIFQSLIHLGKLKTGDSVAVPANTFVASFIAISQANLNIVPVDVDPITRNLSLSCLEKVKSNIQAVLFVHLYGNIDGVVEAQSFCNDNSLLLIEDAAQAHLATCSKGTAGEFGIAAGFSFYPGKNIGALGDAGAITTNNTDLANCAKMFRNYGSTEKYVHEVVGANNRLDELQAAILSVKLKYAYDEKEHRQSLAKYYCEHIVNEKIKLPIISDWDAHAWHLFVIEVNDREQFQSYLLALGIETLIHYPIPCHQQPCYIDAMGHLTFPVTESLSRSIVSIPLSPCLTLEQCHRVVLAINAY